MRRIHTGNLTLREPSEPPPHGEPEVLARPDAVLAWAALTSAIAGATQAALAIRPTRATSWLRPRVARNLGAMHHGCFPIVVLVSHGGADAALKTITLRDKSRKVRKIIGLPGIKP